MWINVLLACGMCLLLGLVAPTRGDPAMGDGNVGRPSRPQVFTSPEELRTYLEQLSNYFAIAGRPRFGKRFAPSPQYRPSLKQLLSSNNNNNNNNNNDDIDDNSNNNNILKTSSDKFSNYPSPGGTTSDLYQLMYQYDE